MQTVKKIKSAGILIFKNKKVLLVKHKEKAEHKTGAYGIPAGRLEHDETEIEAAIRETYEETCLKIYKKYLKPLPTLYFANIQRKNGQIKNFSLRVFLCSYFDGKPKETEENIPKWVNVDKLGKYNLLPNMKKIIFEGLELLK
jgi:8-oxo-dGTP pyrophosphatase MutT (NUDIX family)